MIRNESRDRFWQQESPYILVECKNWSRPAGRSELVIFQDKLARRFGRAKLGFFVAPGGFTTGFLDGRRHEGQGDILVVCIGPEGLETLVTSHDRNAALKELHDRAIIDANGGSD